MGTSTSFRAPVVPRWQAFTTALQSELPFERVRSELFNAGSEWEAAIASPAVAAFAMALLEAVDVLPDRMASADRPERVVQAYVATTRMASAEMEPSAALPLAERALSTMLLRSASGDAALSTRSGQDAAQLLATSLSESASALTGYLGEVLGQYARHVTAREIGRLTEGDTGVSVTTARETTRLLAAAAQEIGRSVQSSAADLASVHGSWASLVHKAFERGRQLPREPE